MMTLKYKLFKDHFDILFSIQSTKGFTKNSKWILYKDAYRLTMKGLFIIHINKLFIPRSLYRYTFISKESIRRQCIQFGLIEEIK